MDLLIVATDTPDQPSPATSAVLQAKLGAHRAGLFDVNAACAGFVTALDLGARLIATDPRLRRVLVVGIYGMSRFLDVHDKATGTLFARGAGAGLLLSPLHILPCPRPSPQSVLLVSLPFNRTTPTN